MLLNKFFHITAKMPAPDTPGFAIRLNPEHEIYNAHFPGHPVTPGVCQIQIVTELLALHLGEEVRLTDVKNVKFMAVVSPRETTDLSVQFTKIATNGDTCKITAILDNGGQIFSKMSMTYHVVRNHSDL